MRLENIAGLTFDHLFGRMLQRALIALAIAASSIVAIYYFTVAGSLALETQYGTLHADLIIGAIYVAIAAGLAIWWVAQRRPAIANAPALSHQRDMQITMLVEAVMLGYALARKGSRVS